MSSRDDRNQNVYNGSDKKWRDSEYMIKPIEYLLIQEMEKKKSRRDMSTFRQHG